MSCLRGAWSQSCPTRWWPPPGRSRKEWDRAALARYPQARDAGAQVLQLLRSTPWDRSDLVRVPAVLDELDQELQYHEQERQRVERAGGAHGGRRRLGAGSLEAKVVRGFGPYLYYRFREGGRHRSVYVGKLAVNAS